ncbi:hypothetical protein ACIA5A_25615 [Micromonospora sp. NPDC051300]|uniref:hypothetical protein n=1 Tax=Micromonospora sp. NPDC051300 TaxID=3364286 RepID=UPI0037919D62
MTYRQLFDDLIGEPPVSTVDVERVIGGQRRARRLRIGAGATAVAAVVAAVLVGTTSLIGKPHAQPAKPAPAVTTTPGTDQDLDRIDAAVVAALTRAEPRLAWAVKGGPVIDTPNWASDLLDRNGTPDYQGGGTFRVAGADLSAELQIIRDGARIWAEDTKSGCYRTAIECGERTGPDGDKIRYSSSVREQEVPPQLRDRIESHSEIVRATALRRDGVLVELSIQTLSAEARMPLTAEQVIPVVLDRAVAPAPIPSPSPTRASTVTTVAGTPEDAKRLDEALTAALRRQADGFTWMTGWGGADSPNPVGSEPNGRLVLDTPVFTYATFRFGARAGQITLRLVRDGEAAWAAAPPCPTAGLAARHCTVSDTPDGQRVRARRLLTGFGPRADGARPTLSNNYVVESLRPDGTLVRLYLVQDKPALTLAQATEVARDPALVLAPRPPAGTATARLNGPPVWDFDGAVQDGASAALDAVSPEGTIYLLLSGGGGGGKGAGHLSFSFLVERAGLTGDGEIIVERRAAMQVNCATVRALPPALHANHAHDGECTESTRDGNRVVSIVSRSAGTVVYDVFVQRPDRGMVEVVLDNRPNTGAKTDMPTDGNLGSRWPKGVRGGATPPLTVDQVTALAAHPDLLNLLP